jgi:hypothetical protein|tara:strand:+ start:266 stop:643 length:378 start_codon:yes stop_codon:yes gene_type:complete
VPEGEILVPLQRQDSDGAFSLGNQNENSVTGDFGEESQDENKEAAANSYLDGGDLQETSFIQPEMPSDIAFPKIFNKSEVPNDTVGAIYKANAKSDKKMDRFPARLNEESLATNSHMNATKTLRK